MRLAIALLLLAGGVVRPLAGQRVPVGDPLEDYLRLLSVTGATAGGSFAVRPAVALPAAGDTLPPWAARLPLTRTSHRGGVTTTVFDPTLRVYHNSGFAWGQNDGAVWRGRGVTTALDWGGAVRWRRLTVTVRPQLIYTGNSDFPLAPDTAPTRFSRFVYPYHLGQGSQVKIDLPQRFGGDAFWAVDPGQSGVTFGGDRLLVGAGTANLWWGPARANAIVMSNNAAGVPHAWIGTARPLSIGIGAIEVQWLWGRLSESAYYDSVAGNDHRFLTAIVGTFQPRLLPGLHVGATRAYMENYPAGGLAARDYLLVFNGITKNSLATPSNPFGDDARDQMLSLFARWNGPGSGFEAYAEWARNDHNADMRDLLVEPEHSQGYTLGFQQATPLRGGRLLRVHGELTRLERESTRLIRGSQIYYVHHVVAQGYTQRGQVLGAGVGPGGNSQRLGADLFAPWGRVGFTLLRQVRDNDAFYLLKSQPIVDSNNVLSFKKHDVVAGVALNAAAFLGAWMVDGEVSLLRNYNRHYLFKNDVGNVGLALTVRRALAPRQRE